MSGIRIVSKHRGGTMDNVIHVLLHLSEESSFAHHYAIRDGLSLDQPRQMPGQAMSKAGHPIITSLQYGSTPTKLPVASNRTTDGSRRISRRLKTIDDRNNAHCAGTDKEANKEPSLHDGSICSGLKNAPQVPLSTHLPSRNHLHRKRLSSDPPISKRTGTINSASR